MKLTRNLDLIIGPTKEFLARQQRSMGHSLKDISKEFDIPITSLRRLCGDIKLTDEQKKKLLSKKKNKSIILNYKNNNIIINGKIKIKLLKKRNFVNDIDQLILKYILTLLSLQNSYPQVKSELN